MSRLKAIVAKFLVKCKVQSILNLQFFECTASKQRMSTITLDTSWDVVVVAICVTQFLSFGVCGINVETTTFPKWLSCIVRFLYVVSKSTIDWIIGYFCSFCLMIFTNEPCELISAKFPMACNVSAQLRSSSAYS